MWYGWYVGVRLNRGPVRFTVRDIVSVESRGDSSEGVGRARDKGVCILDHFFEIEVILEAGPAFGKGASAVIVGGVGGCISIFVLHKIEVPPP